MGLMRFMCPPDRITEEAVQQAYLSGYDRVPWLTEARQADGELQLERTVSDSATLHIPWHVESHGLLTLCTTTLMERPETYDLPLELARGKIAQIRNQLAEWETIGLTAPQEIKEKLADAVGYFAQAAVLEHGSERSVQLAEAAIRAALDAADMAATSYTEQVLAVRRHGSGKLPAFLGADLGDSLLDNYTSAQYLETFNAANLAFCWRAIETSQGNYDWQISDEQVLWCRANGLKVCAGPLLRLDERGVPDWLTLYEGEFDSLMGFVSDFLNSVVNRYRGQIDLWQCAGRANTSEILSLTEEEKVKLVARSVEVTSAVDPNAIVAVSFDQPWGEYLSRREMDFPPLHFADALVRANLGLSGLMLEINVGYHPGGTLPRHPLEFSLLLDSWSLLGVPLFLALSVPSSSDADPLAQRRTKLPPDIWTTRSQQEWVTRYVPLLLAKPGVHGVIWNQLRDYEPHEFPHGGLFDLRYWPKPALRELASIRQALLE